MPTNKQNIKQNGEPIGTVLARAQLEFPTADKSGANPFFDSNYATLDDGIKVVRPVLNKHGVAILQPVLTVPERTELKEDGTKTHFPRQDYVVTKLIYGDQAIQTEVPIIFKEGDCQSYGSGMTYARRYGLFALTCLACGEKDDDGNKALGEERMAAKSKRSNYNRKPKQEAPATTADDFLAKP